MGFRTVVVLSNDQASDWIDDSDLGSKIMHAGLRPTEYFPYGQVLEQVHGDTQTVAILDGYGGKRMVSESWRRDEAEDAKNLRLLKALANKLGYSVRKKSA